MFKRIRKSSSLSKSVDKITGGFTKTIMKLQEAATEATKASASRKAEADKLIAESQALDKVAERSNKTADRISKLFAIADEVTETEN